MPVKWFNYLSIEPGPTDGLDPAWWLHHRSLARSADKNHYLLANEWICSSLAWHIRLPIPPFAAMRKADNSKRYFASLDYGTLESQPTDMNPENVCRNHLRLASGVIVSDIWFANPDRHEGNIKVDNPDDPKRVEIFDYDLALFGHVAHRGIERLQSCAGRLGFTKLGSSWEVHKLATAIHSTAEFTYWIDRISAVPPSFISDVCREAEELGITTPEADIAIQFLDQRRQDIAAIVEHNRSFFESVKEWGLPI